MRSGLKYFSKGREKKKESRGKCGNILITVESCWVHRVYMGSLSYFLYFCVFKHVCEKVDNVLWIKYKTTPSLHRVGLLHFFHQRNAPNIS